MAEETGKKETRAKVPAVSAAEPPELGRRYKKGDRIKGSTPPHGGSWIYDAQKDELTLVEEPTQKD